MSRYALAARAVRGTDGSALWRRQAAKLCHVWGVTPYRFPAALGEGVALAQTHLVHTENQLLPVGEKSRGERLSL